MRGSLGLNVLGTAIHDQFRCRDECRKTFRNRRSGEHVPQLLHLVPITIAHARDVGCFFESNSSPDRLDLSDKHALLAKAAGVKIAINTDAHSTRELSFLSAGIHQARRSWLEAADVLNTRSWRHLQAVVKR